MRLKKFRGNINAPPKFGCVEDLQVSFSDIVENGDMPENETNLLPFTVVQLHDLTNE